MKQNLNDLAANDSVQADVESKVVLPSPGEPFSITRSTLVLKRVGQNEVTGQYWCNVEDQHSETLQLYPPGAYQNLSLCPNNAVQATLKNYSSSEGGDCSRSSTCSSPHNPSNPSPRTTSRRQRSSSKTTTGSDHSRLGGSNPNEFSLLQGFSSLGLIVISVIVGILLCTVLVLLMAVFCMCCKRKRSKVQRMKKGEMVGIN